MQYVPAVADQDVLRFHVAVDYSVADTIKAESVSLVWAIAEAECGVGKGPYLCR